MAFSDWPPADRELIAWFVRTVSEIPREPFDLWRWAHVRDVERFLDALRFDVKAGPRGPRARRGVLQEDLRRLRELFYHPAARTAPQAKSLTQASAAVRAVSSR